MATPFWAFYPHPGGAKRRGLEVNTNGAVTWAACNTTETRTQTIWLPGPADATFKSGNEAVVTAAYGTQAVGGFRNVVVTSKGAGKTFLTASRSGGVPAYLAVDVFRPLEMLVRFVAIDTERWRSNLTAGKVQRLLEAVNLIYRYQGNVRFTPVGEMRRTTLTGLAREVDVDDMFDHTAVRDCGAQTTIYFVRRNDALAGHIRDLIMMEDVQAAPWDEMTLAHELGHRMGLDHPDPPLPSNLMNKTSVGDRHRYKIYLTMAQIRTITDVSKWATVPSHDPNICPAP